MWQQRSRDFLRESFLRGVSIYWTLLRLTLPILIAVKVLDEQFDIISKTGDWLAPLMNVVGLPGDAAIVFATALFLQVYAAILVMASLWAHLELTVAQVTILMTMMLLAHALPVELRIVQKAGMPMLPALLLRLGGAFALGAILHWIYGDAHLQQRAEIAFLPGKAAEGWTQWAYLQLRSWAAIFLILQGMVLFIGLLRVTHAERALIWALSPALRLMGIGDKTVNMAMVGMLLGLSYGGGLLIEESRKGLLNRRDVLCTLSLLCLCHALVEDTLLVVFVGADVGGVLLARVVFSFAAVALLNVFLSRYLAAAPAR